MSYQGKRTLLIIGILLVLSVLLFGCGQATPEPTEPPRPTAVVAPTSPPAPAPTQPTEPTGPAEPPTPALEIPFEAMWAASGHAQAESESFTHWNEESPAEIPVACAKCHSSFGFHDYVGADGSAFGEVNAPAQIGSVITCVTCHNEATVNLNHVVFPSGIEVTGLGNESVCMTCHQGTSSMTQVNASIERAGVTDEDAVAADLGFTNIHYYAAAITRLGTVVKGGYEYEGRTYDALFDHVQGISTCTDCHDPHSLEVRVDLCSECHTQATSVEAMRDIRTYASLVDYDGDGDVREGVFYEIEGLRNMLYSAMQTYAREVSQTPLVYDSHAYPYFFIDTNDDGEVSEGEAAFPNRYNAWTPRMAKAAFNFQTSIKDPGMYAHGGKYIIELLYDSIENMNEGLSTPVDLSTARRTDVGHFDGSSESFRHWDGEGEVPAACARCHSGAGLPVYLANATNVAEHPSNGLMCESCHDDVTTFTRFEVENVRFPSGRTVSLDNLDSNLCLECHQGRESTVSVNNAIQGLAPHAPAENLRFRNVHYFAAGATLFGNEVMGAYQYDNQQYIGRFTHVPNFDTCIECHDSHALAVNDTACTGCHQTDDLLSIRGGPGVENAVDYDGDGDVTEGIAGEISTMQETLYEELRNYTRSRLGATVVYDSHAYPYFFTDANDDGVRDADERGYATWSPTMLKAAYNYQYSQKDPGGYAHNARYILQVLYDSIRDLGGNVRGMTRP